MARLYVEPFSGISGNMFLGALLDLGASFAKVETELKKLKLGEYQLIYEHVDKCGIHATHFDVLLPELHEHHHDQEHRHDEEAHHHAHHEEQHVHQQEQHSDFSPHSHHHEHRNLAAILEIINNSTLSESIKLRSAQVFTELGKAEAKVHGKSLEEIHFHEVGAIDTIIDIVGCLLALEDLGIDTIYTGKLQTGQGFVRCAHGLMPIPAPATAELLKDLPYYQGNITRELVTPTGAALLHTLAKSAEELPPGFQADSIGYGAGTWDLSIPIVLRLHLERQETPNNQGKESLFVLATNLDDSTGEVCGFVTERLLAAGALDAWYTPIYMKKGRPAWELSVLAGGEMLPHMQKIIFTETSTLGVRIQAVDRTALTREIFPVQLSYGTIRVKAAFFEGKLVNVAPEYEDCKKIAMEQKIPLKIVLAQAGEEGRKIATSGL